MRILAFGAHSDDMDFFCGGTLTRFSQEGNAVGICCLADGRTGGKAETPEKLAELRRREFLESASVIDAEAFWLGIEDGMVMDSLENRLALVEIIRSFQPDLLITHPPDDYHPDHVATSRLVMDASFLSRSTNIKTKSVRVTGVAPLLFCDSESGHNFLPDEYVDVSEVWEKKAQMLNVHRSQYEGWVNPISGQPENWVLARALVLSRFRGLQSNVLYAEAFKVFRAHGRVRAFRLLP